MLLHSAKVLMQALQRLVHKVLVQGLRVTSHCCMAHNVLVQGLAVTVDASGATHCCKPQRMLMHKSLAHPSTSLQGFTVLCVTPRVQCKGLQHGVVHCGNI